jgi:putative ABC transport system permease protein
MYVIKNALRSITRSKGRNVLIGIIVLVIALSSCLALSIREAANTAKEDAIADLNITASISFDRSSAMKDSKPSDDGEFDKSAMKEAMQGAMQGLTLDEYKTYATAKSVSDFYYSASVSVDGSDDLEAVSSNEEYETDSSDTSDTTETTDTSQSQMPNDNQAMPSDMQGGGDMGGGRMSFMGTQGDFTFVGYSSETAMTDFVSGVCSISDGAVFDEATDTQTCIISDELATYNNVSVGDVITFTNPNDEDETFDLTVVGIYTNTSSTTSQGGFMSFDASSDSANQVYMSYETLTALLDSLDSSSDEDTALTSQISATYVFASLDDYEAFDSQARELGLDDSYTISSVDVDSYEQSLVPLDNISKFATYFLIIILAIGAVILIVLNIFSIRERKYEIGVMTAIGMKKGKVASQFITEIFAVTLVAMLVGVIIATPISVPVTNALLENQISSQTEQTQQQEENFGRGDQGGDFASQPDSNDKGDATDKKDNGNSVGFGVQTEYVSKVTSATDFKVIVELFAIAIFLTLISSLIAVISIMRYNPLKILSERD